MNYELEKLKSAKNKIRKADTQLRISIGAKWETAKNVDTDYFSVSVHLLGDFILGF